jgi:[acyl-carrier-protein] S-malonyltransferase
MLAFTFPGQGSQRPGMGRPWVHHDSWELVEEASAVADRDLGRLLLDADAEELKDTRNAQLCTFLTSLMVLDAVERLGIDAAYCAGHSLGEYTALVASGALGFDDGVRLVSERAEAMHDAGLEQPGTMAAVLGLDDDDVEIACRRADHDVWVANFNAPGQVVIAGSQEGVAAAGVEAKALGAKKVMPLPVAGAFHTPFMAPARDRLRKAIAEALPRDTEMPIVSNVDALAHQQGDEWASLLSAQLCSPVRWKHGLLRLSELGVTDFVELGPGGVLTGMAKRSVPNARTITVAVPDDLDPLLDFISQGRTHAQPRHVEGELLFATERLVVSPAAGVFTPVRGLGHGSSVEVGDVIGYVAGAEVRSAFAGVLQDYIAVDGERLAARQPVAWLRTA